MKGVRTTITVDPDIHAEMERMRREDGLGPSDAINTLARRGMVVGAPRRPYAPPPARSLGKAHRDVSNIGEVLALLDDEDAAR